MAAGPNPLTAALAFPLDGTLEDRTGAAALSAELGPGARFIPSAEGQGVEPGPTGHAVAVPIPDQAWKPHGTLAFRIRPSRRFSFQTQDPAQVVIARCPLFEMTLSEGPHYALLTVRMAHDETVTDTRALSEAAEGDMFLSHLKAGEWYHLALAWDAPNGRLEVYLNGSIQQELRTPNGSRVWRPPVDPRGALFLGGAAGEGERAVRFAVDSIELHPSFMDAAAVAATLNGRPNFPLAGEGLWDWPGALDLTPYRLALDYEADFSQPLDVVAEDALFEADKRVRLPQGRDWVLEGEGRAWTENGRCVMANGADPRNSHLVLWNTRVFPGNFLLEFGMSPTDSDRGLAIVFFAARSRAGGLPFDLGLPRRDGRFPAYHSGALNCYHCSYWATEQGGGGRRTANLRKNHGFFMPAAGIDRITGAGPGPHTVRLLKVGNRIALETNGRLALLWEDDGRTYGPVLTDGLIGLRQMVYSTRVEYTHLRVWKVEPPSGHWQTAM